MMQHRILSVFKSGFVPIHQLINQKWGKRKRYKNEIKIDGTDCCVFPVHQLSVPQKQNTKVKQCLST